jgi:DNA mismatch repair ATPase MutL
VKEQAELLMRISDKELRGERLTDEDCSQLEHIGATFEYISLDLARSKDQELMGWDDIQSADKNVACVADVYTANGDNNPNHTVLYEAVGPVNEIYVLVNMDGDLYLTRGAVLSYREFQQPTAEQRLTDEEWQKKLKEHPTLGIPKWMDDITVPLEQQPQENEEISYSSGC